MPTARHVPPSTDRPAKPRHTFLPMILWTVGILLILGLAWFAGAAAIPIWQTRRVVAEIQDGGVQLLLPPGQVADDVIPSIDASPEYAERLGGPERAARRLGLYLRLPDRIAPHKTAAAVLLRSCGDAATPELLRAFDHRNDEVRALALDRLVRKRLLPVEKLESLVARGLADESKPVRQAAAWVLDDGDLKLQAPIDALTAAVRRGDGVVRIVCAPRLKGPEARSEAVVGALVEALKDQEPRARANAAGALHDIGPDAKIAVPGLVTCLADPDESVRLNAVAALARVTAGEKVSAPHFQGPSLFSAGLGGSIFGWHDDGGRRRLVRGIGPGQAATRPRREAILDERTVTAVAGLLEDASKGVRLDAAATLGSAGPAASAALPALRKALDDTNTDVRANVLWAIWMIREEPPWQELEKLLTCAEPAARAEAVWTLGLLGTEHPRFGPEIDKAFADSSGKVRLAAARLHLLAGRDKAAAIRVLASVLGDEDTYSRARAAEELGRLGPEAATALAAVEPLLANAEGFVRADAALAHWRISGQSEPATGMLIAMLASGRDNRYAARALSEMGPAASAAAEHLERILAAPANETDFGETARAYLKVGGDRSRLLPLLIKGLELKHLNAQIEAAQLLGEMGPAAAEAIPALEQLIRREDYDSVRGAAEKALTKIRGEGK